MPIYNFKGIKGRSGYSGVNSIQFGDEVLAQNTFNPDYDLWTFDVGTSSSTFDENGLHVWASGSQFVDLWQDSGDFLTAVLPSTLYTLEFVIENLLGFGDLYLEIYLGGEYLRFQLENYSEGVNTIDFETPETGGDYFDFYIEGPGMGHMGGNFYVTSLSIKSKTFLGGDSGYSGEVPEVVQCEQIDSTTEETLVEDFNTLLASLQSTGWMESS